MIKFYLVRDYMTLEIEFGTLSPSSLSLGLH